MMPLCRWALLCWLAATGWASAAGPPSRALTAPFRLVRVVEAGLDKPRALMAFAPHGTLLATSGREGIAVWDAVIGRRVIVKPRIEGFGPYALAFVGRKELACCMGEPWGVHLGDIDAFRPRLVIKSDRVDGLTGIFPLPNN